MESLGCPLKGQSQGQVWVIGCKQECDILDGTVLASPVRNRSDPWIPEDRSYPPSRFSDDYTGYQSEKKNHVHLAEQPTSSATWSRCACKRGQRLFLRRHSNGMLGFIRRCPTEHCRGNRKLPNNLTPPTWASCFVKWAWSFCQDSFYYPEF